MESDLSIFPIIAALIQVVKRWLLAMAVCFVRFRRVAWLRCCREDKGGPSCSRLLALAASADGAKRTEARRSARRTSDHPGLGLRSRAVAAVSERHIAGSALEVNGCAPSHCAIAERPTPALHGVLLWRLIDLAHGYSISSHHHLPSDAQPVAARRVPQTAAVRATAQAGA